MAAMDVYQLAGLKMNHEILLNASVPFRAFGHFFRKLTSCLKGKLLQHKVESGRPHK
jgi:hypothetical protein